MSLVTNGSFLTGDLTGWLAASSASPPIPPVADSFGRPTGPTGAGGFYWSTRFDLPTTSTGGGFLNQTITVLPSSTYTMFFYFYAAGPNVPLCGYSMASSATTSATAFPPVGVWTQYSLVHTTGPLSTTMVIQIFASTSFFINTYDTIYADQVRVFANPICYAPGTLIRVQEKLTSKLIQLEVERIRSSEHLVVVKSQRSVPIAHHVISGPVTRLCCLPTGLLSEDSPSSDLFLTRGHKVLVGEDEIKACDLEGSVPVRRREGVMVHSLILEERDHIYANDALVVAQSVAEWDEIKHHVPHEEV